MKREILEKIAKQCEKIKGKNQTKHRKELFENLCKENGIEFEYVGEKPSGHACGINEMSKVFRFFPRVDMVNTITHHVTR